jgi:mycothiol synthase
MARDSDLPEGFAIRRASAEDARAIAELINAVTLAEIGLPWTSTEEVRDQLTVPGRDPALAPAVVVESGGAIVGHLELERSDEPFEMHVLAFVHPRLWGRGLSAFLIRRAEEVSRVSAAPARPGIRVFVSRFTANRPAARLFVALGYERARTFWMMQIRFEEPPPDPVVPDGIAIRTFRPGLDDAETHAALAEAFVDHWGSAFPSFDEWRHREIRGEGSGFDPTLWFLATEGEEVVGAACCRASSPRSVETAQVSEVAVRRPWRRRGVALALLHTAFAEFHRREIRAAELAVDALNPTGATALYERAGMTEALSWEVWEKVVHA